MKINRKAFIVIIVIFFLLLLYLIVNPIIMTYDRVLIPRKLYGLENARLYYTIINNVFGLIITIMGLFLGYYFYKSRLEYDNTVATRERKRTHLNYMLKELNKFDSLVDNVLGFRFNNKESLNELRTKIDRRFENITVLLDENQKLIGLTNEELKIILKVNSFIDKNKVIMYEKYSKLNRKVMTQEKDKYIDLIQSARRVCYSKFE